MQALIARQLFDTWTTFCISTIKAKPKNILKILDEHFFEETTSLLLGFFKIFSVTFLSGTKQSKKRKNNLENFNFFHENVNGVKKINCSKKNIFIRIKAYLMNDYFKFFFKFHHPIVERDCVFLYVLNVCLNPNKFTSDVFIYFLLWLMENRAV